MDARQLRLAQNEVLFRDVNESIESVALGNRGDGHTFEFVCECSNLDCTLRLRMTIQAYEAVRRDPAAFIVALGHELPEIEAVLSREAGYQVVRKVGEAAALVAAEDPRA